MERDPLQATRGLFVTWISYHTQQLAIFFLPRTPSRLIEATKTRPHVVAYYLKFNTAAPLRFLIHMLAIVTPDVLACFPQ